MKKSTDSKENDIYLSRILFRKSALRLSCDDMDSEYNKIKPTLKSKIGKISQASKIFAFESSPVILSNGSKNISSCIKIYGNEVRLSIDVVNSDINDKINRLDRDKIVWLTRVFIDSLVREDERLPADERLVPAEKAELAVEEVVGTISRLQMRSTARANLEAFSQGIDTNQLKRDVQARWPEDRHSGENPITFVSRNYAAWLGKGLTRPHLRIIDVRLYNALTVWLHRHPEDRALLDLPTKSECVDGLIASAMSHGSIVDQLAEGGSADRAKALERLAKNMANRANRARLER